MFKTERNVRSGEGETRFGVRIMRFVPFNSTGL